ncbi:phage tail assembly protein [Pseudomonas capsici]|uniref:phage tail assembly protein n=1 Tax=Pseudomonas capsici TaxID=2810614 RepID=UPI0021F0DA32|nr:phage tail assembly protein [Pseudomonas capsici]MCV4272293.1 phage tail assembly protein [Pseudomonas capsici]
MADTLKIPLKFPFNNALGTRIESLPITRLKRKDIASAQKYSADAADQEDFLVAKMTSMTMEDLSDLDIADSATLTKVFRGMAEGQDLAAILGRSAAPGDADATVGDSESGNAGLPVLG